VAAREELRAATQIVIERASTHGVLVVAVEDDVYAVDNLCTHSAVLTLHEGDIDVERREIVCRWHSGRFSLTSGAPARLPCSIPLRTYDVHLVGDQVYVAVPEYTPVPEEGEC